MEKDIISPGPAHIDQLKKYADDLTRVYKSEKHKRKELKAANRELQEAYLEIIHRLVLAAEYKDEDTGDHIVRMSRYSALIAEKLGLQDKEVQDILCAAPMHDVGKIGIPDNILLKPAKLTDEEHEIMKTHTTIGAKILANSKAKIIQLAQQIAVSHHEKWNGKGYPQGHSGDKIPQAGRIVALADAFDAITSRRPYQDPYPVEVAFDIIKKERGQHFDPEAVDAFLKNTDGILKIKAEVGSADDVDLADFTWSERDRADGTPEDLSQVDKENRDE
jgi:putative two-component system response regulator